jgi:predicted phage replisome organizer
MSIGKRYYLKLESDFFQDLKVKKLRKSKKGDVYICIYLKLMLLSTKDFGLITFQNIEDTLYEELALTFDEELEDVKNTMEFLEKEGVLLQTDDNEYLFEKLCDNVVTETEYARQMRRYRAKKKEELGKNITQIEHNKVKLQCNNDVTTMSLQCNSPKKEDNLSVNKAEFITTLNDDISNKIIPVTSTNNKENQDGK